MTDRVVYRGVEIESFCLPNSKSVGGKDDKIYCDAVGCFETPVLLTDGYVLCVEHAAVLESTEEIKETEGVEATDIEEWSELFEFTYVNADGDVITHSIDRDGVTLEDIRAAFDTFLIAVGYSIEDSTSEVE